jgi:AcrR family transcriptional regulator
MTVQPAPRARTNKREAIITAAAELFSERSFEGTGISDIAAAVGITGGAVYRHFDSKQEVLRTIVQRAVEQVVAKVEEIVASTSVEDRLPALVENLVRAMLENRTLTSVMFYEASRLDDEMREFVDRAHRLHATEWAHALSVLRPELSDAERATLVQLVYASVVAGVGYPSGLDDDRLAQLLQGAAMSILFSDHESDGGRP